MADINGAFSFDGEELHYLAVHVEHHHADDTLVIVSAEGELILGGIGIDLNVEIWLRHMVMYIHKQSFIVAIGNHFARYAQQRIVWIVAIGASVLSVDAVRIIGVTLVDVVRIELVG